MNYLNIIILSALLACSVNSIVYAQSNEVNPIILPSFCTANPSECSQLGMISQTLKKSESENRCGGSDSVLCTVPEITARPDIADANNQFNVLSYNIFDRPFIISHDGQIERTCRIPGEIFKQIGSHHNIDAIVIQEAFTGGCRSGANLRTLLAYYGFPYATPTVDKSTSLSNGGIFIASKWPIAFSESHVFNSCTGSDCLASKGIMYVRINKKVAHQNLTIKYHLFGAHFNAWEGEEQAKVRLEQAEQILAFIDKQNIPKAEAVIIAGDLNINRLGNSSNRSEVIQVLGALHAVMPIVIGDQRYTTDPVHNPLALESESTNQWLDYVLYSTQYLKPIEFSMQSIVLHTAKPFKTCMKAKFQPVYVSPDSTWCNKTTRLIDLSDHYPVLGRFRY